MLASFTRPTGSQYLVCRVGKDLFDDSAEFELSSVTIEQCRDGRRHHRRPSQGMPDCRRAKDQCDGMRRSASTAERVARAYDSASAIARLISGWWTAAASASISPSVSISSAARSKTANRLLGTWRRISTTSGLLAPLVPIRRAKV